MAGAPLVSGGPPHYTADICGKDPFMENDSIVSIASIIQISVAPVFLLAGIAGFLNVLSSRLGRIIDRARVIARQLHYAQQDDQQQLLQQEASALWNRIRLINWSIRMCVSGALLVCLVIITLFIGDLAPFSLAMLVGLLFVAAMLTLVTGLILFLFEVSVSTRNMRRGMEIALDEHKPG